MLQTHSVFAAFCCIGIDGFENIRVEKINGESAKKSIQNQSRLSSQSFPAP